MDHAVQLDARPARERVRSLTTVPAGPLAPVEPLTVFLADAHDVVRLGIEHLLERTDDLQLVGATASADEARRAVVEGWADIVLIDADLDGAGGHRLSRDLADAASGTRWCFLVGETEPAAVAELSRHGASGFLHKRAAGHHLVDALRRLASDGLVMDPIMAEVLMATLLDPHPRPRHGELSERDLELLRLLGEGRTNKEIAAAVFLSEKTVKNYLSRLFRKLGVRSRTEAALLSARFHPAPPSAAAGDPS